MNFATDSGAVEGVLPGFGFWAKQAYCPVNRTRAFVYVRHHREPTTSAQRRCSQSETLTAQHKPSLGLNGFRRE